MGLGWQGLPQLLIQRGFFSFEGMTRRTFQVAVFGIF